MQGAGVGRQVLAWAENFARNTLGAKIVEMEVIWSRKELIEWYIRRGYWSTGEVRPFPEEALGDGALQADLHFEVLAKTL